VLADIAAVIAPIFVCAGIGMAWIWSGKAFNTEMVTEISFNLGIPCIIFSTLTRLTVSTEAFAEMAVIYAIATLGFLALGAIVLKLAGLPLTTFLPGQGFCNNGNMGLPLSLFAFGEQGLAYAISTFVISSIGSFTVGMGIYSGRPSWGLVWRNPIIYGLLLTLVFMLSGTKPPQWLSNTTQILGGVAIPMMLISLGVAMARLKIAGFGRALFLSVLRIGGGFAIGLAIAEIAGLHGAARGVLLMQSAMPVAVNNYLLAQRFNRNPSEVAGTVVVSTALSFATLPLLLYFVLG